MLEERARVLSVGGHSVWVEANRQQGCAKCEAGEGCGGGMLNKLVRRKDSRLEARSDLADLKPGDAVIVGFDETALLKVSVMAYLMPLIGMFTAAIITNVLFEDSDLLVALAGLFGLAAGFLYFNYFAKRHKLSGEYQPRVLRRSIISGEGCQIYEPQSQREK